MSLAQFQIVSLGTPVSRWTVFSEIYDWLLVQTIQSFEHATNVYLMSIWFKKLSWCLMLDDGMHVNFWYKFKSSKNWQWAITFQNIKLSQDLKRSEVYRQPRVLSPLSRLQFALCSQGLKMCLQWKPDEHTQPQFWPVWGALWNITGSNKLISCQLEGRIPNSTDTPLTGLWSHLLRSSKDESHFHNYSSGNLSFRSIFDSSCSGIPITLKKISYSG